MAQYPIPQFIESEGKIISFLTFRQFFLLVGGGAVCVMLYFTLPFFLFAIFGVGVMGLVGAIAFVKVDNVSIIKILLNFIRFSTGKKNYVWKKEESPYPFKLQEHYEVKNIPDSPTLRVRASNLKEAKKAIDTKR